MLTCSLEDRSTGGSYLGYTTLYKGGHGGYEYPTIHNAQKKMYHVIVFGIINLLSRYIMRYSFTKLQVVVVFNHTVHDLFWKNIYLNNAPIEILI